jgi:hypothetical protein
MAGALNSIGNFFRGLALLGLVVLLGAGSLVGYQAYNKHYQLEDDLRSKKELLAAADSQIAKLNGEILVKNKQIAELDLAVRLLKVDHRLAEIKVLSQKTDPTGKISTKIQFVEVDDEGHPIDAPRDFTIDGDIVYVDSWVVKYEDRLVQTGDPMRSTSICLFRRLFGESQKPVEGYELDKVGAEPVIYNRGQQVSEQERDIWSRFWDYANDPALAAKSGMRAVNGEAPSTQLRPGKLYKVELRASGGLSIKPEDVPTEKPTT